MWNPKQSFGLLPTTSTSVKERIQLSIKMRMWKEFKFKYPFSMGGRMLELGVKKKEKNAAIPTCMRVS